MQVYFKIIRYPNLLIIALTMYLMRFCLYKPLLAANGFSLQMSEWHFALLVLSTMLLSAAGYIINDINDVNADKINKPHKVYIGSQISENSAMNYYWVLNLLAIAMGIYVSNKVNLQNLSMAFVFVSGLLYFYSNSYKRILVLGNLMVAFFAGLVPIMVLLFELPLIKNVYSKEILVGDINFNYLIYWMIGYASFAFLISLIREIIKDIEDFEGDNAYGLNTLPIAIGVKPTKIIVQLLLMFTGIALFYLHFNYLPDLITLIYLALFLLLPIFYCIYVLFKANQAQHYHKAGNICKIIMLTGVLYTIIVKFIISHN